MQKEIAYNKKSAEKYGWTPEWFDAKGFNEELIVNIMAFQARYRLLKDGKVGPTTYRRIWTERESELDELEPRPSFFSDSIVHNGNFYPIKWDKVVHWFDEDGLEGGTFKSLAGSEERSPTMFVNHWDVCLNSASMAKVLKQRGLSVHFAIDNDGTIYQLLDTQHVAYHAGSKLINDLSIGVEISNAFYPKYQDTYVKRGHGQRPLIPEMQIHGLDVEEHLGFYQVQLDALAALWRAVSDIHGIPLEVPEENCDEIYGKYRDAVSGDFEGFVSHYHLTENKIDCAGLDHIGIAREAVNL